MPRLHCIQTLTLILSPVLVVLQFFSRFATVSPALAALPLLVVLAITAIKDGYEDLKRHQSDRAINGIQVSGPHSDYWIMFLTTSIRS